ncbi:transposable element Tcb1 transposase [Trichonephila clavipes]|nr:transposable element Tcb1 transposase [Trichonephila clavipes]
MTSRHHIDDFMRARIIGKIEEERKITDVAREFDIAHSVVSRLWKSFKSTGMCSRRHGGGRVRSTTPAEDRYIVLSAKRNRRTTAQQVANQFLAASGKQISRKTVARRLRGGGLYARRPVVCVPLTRQHRTARLQWCREHRNWTEQDWACVLFSDESRFSLSSDCRRQLIWRESGTAYRPENIQEKDRYPTCSIMVWSGIMIKPTRRRIFLLRNTSLCAVEQFNSDVNLEAVDRRAPNNSKSWQWTTEGVPLYRIPLTANHQRLRLQWAHEHSTWQADWHLVIFSNESRFSLWDHDGRIHVRRYAVERCLPERVIERHSGLTTGVMQDDARPHVAKTVLDFRSPQLLPWPAYSPDMPLIDHVWDLVGRHLARDSRNSASKDELLLRIQTIRNYLPQAGIQNLFGSMLRRIATLIAARGGYTKY